MQVTRIGKDRDLDIDVEVLEIVINGVEFKLKERPGGELSVRTEGSITISPGCANVIYLKGGQI